MVAVKLKRYLKGIDGGQTVVLYYQFPGTKPDEVAERLWHVVAPVVVVCGTIGNLIVLAVFAQRRTRRSAASFLMRNLSVVQTLFLWFVVCLPPGKWTIIDTPGDRIYNRSETWCSLLSFFVQPVLFLYVEALILAMLSVDRAIALTRPALRQDVFYQANMKVIIVFFVCLTQLFNLPYLEAQTTYDNLLISTTSGNKSKGVHFEPMCHHPKHSIYYMYKSEYNILKLVVFEIAPQIVMIGALAFSLFVFWRKIVTNQKVRSHHTKLLKLVMSNVFGYSLLHIPQAALYLSTTISSPLKYNGAFIIYLQLLCMFNFACSFYLYCLPVHGFRDELRGLCRKCMKMKPLCFGARTRAE